MVPNWLTTYSVQRKVAGAAQQLDSIERILGMGLMGLGGLVSTMGGLLFLIIVAQAVRDGLNGLKATSDNE